MTQLTTRQRFARMFEHRPADRVPILDHPWPTTLQRWRREGLPAGVGWAEYLDLDRVCYIHADTSPRFQAQVLEDTPQYKISTTPWGVTLKNWKHIASTPEFIDFVIKDRESWRQAKARMTPLADRVDWDALRKNYQSGQASGAWVIGAFWFGFDVTHSWTVGTERLLVALVEDPDWCVDMWNHELDMCIAQFEMVLQKGYRLDAILWPDDLGYKGHTFMSVQMYRDLLKPVHKRAIDWAHSKGIKACLHSCGDIRTMIPEFVDIGLDCLNPLEVKAGVDALEVKARFGRDLVLHGGMNAVLWQDAEAMAAEIRAKLPVLKQDGGYVWATDHSIPDVVSLEDFRRIVEIVKDVGRY